MVGGDNLGDWLAACTKRGFLVLTTGELFRSHRQALLSVKLLIFVAGQARSGNVVQG